MSDNTFVLNGEKQAVYGSAQFTLYSDPECTQVAKDIDGSEEAGAGRLLGRHRQSEVLQSALWNLLSERNSDA